MYTILHIYGNIIYINKYMYIYIYLGVCFVRLRVVSLVSCSPLKYKSVAVSKW